MDTGMLWYRDSNRPLAEEVERAASYYFAKYGLMPNMCWVPVGAVARPTWVGQVYVAGLRTVLTGHLWLGITDAETLPAAPAQEPDHEGGADSQNL